MIELRDVAGEFSCPRVRGVASWRWVRPIFTTSSKALRLALSASASDVEGVAQGRHPRQQVVLDLLGGGDVHGRGEGVVGGLPAVDVIVGMDRALRAELAAIELDGAVGDHLVGVHIRLGAAAGLPDVEREVVVELARDHFLRRPGDELDLVLGQHPELTVGQGGGLLEDAESTDQRPRKMIVSNVEIAQRALRSGRPSSDPREPRSAPCCRSRSVSCSCHLLC